MPASAGPISSGASAIAFCALSVALWLGPPLPLMGMEYNLAQRAMLAVSVHAVVYVLTLRAICRCADLHWRTLSHVMSSEFVSSPCHFFKPVPRCPFSFNLGPNTASDLRCPRLNENRSGRPSHPIRGKSWSIRR